MSSGVWNAAYEQLADVSEALHVINGARRACLIKNKKLLLLSLVTRMCSELDY